MDSPIDGRIGRMRFLPRTVPLLCVLTAATLPACTPLEGTEAPPADDTIERPVTSPRIFTSVENGLRAELPGGAAHIDGEALSFRGHGDAHPAWALRTVGLHAAPQLRDPHLIVRGDAGRIEEIEVLADGALEQRWHFPSPPPDGRVVVRVAVAHVARVERDDGGLVLHSSQRVAARLHYSDGLWIDATGAEHPVEARWDGEAIVLEVPAEVVAQSQFPAVLDPRLEPIFDIEPPREVRWDGYGFRRTGLRMAGNAHGFLVGFVHDEGSLRFPRVAFLPSAGAPSNPWGTAFEPTPSARTVEVVHEGTGFLVGWLDDWGTGIRFQRLDELGRPLGPSFGLPPSPTVAGDHSALLPSPGSTVARWVRPGLSDQIVICTSRIPHGGSPSGVRCGGPTTPFHHHVADLPTHTWMVASASGWLATWYDGAETRALRFEEASGTYDSLALAASGGQALPWRTARGDYRVLFGTQLVDIPATGPATPTAPAPAGLPTRCQPTGCSVLPTPVQSSEPQLLVWGGELGRLEDDGSWTKLADAPDPTPRLAAQSGNGFAFSDYELVQRFDGTLTPIDATPERPVRRMSAQLFPQIAAAHGRFVVAWSDVDSLPGSPQVRVARLDAAGTFFDATTLDEASARVRAILPVGERFVIIIGTNVDYLSRGRIRAFSIAALGDVDIRASHELLPFVPSKLHLESEGPTGLVAWNDDDGGHLRRIDPEGHATASHTSTDTIAGLCRDTEGTLAVIQRDGQWWVARVAPSGSPTTSPLWRWGSIHGGDALVVSLDDHCIALWPAGGWQAATFDGLGLLRGPTLLTPPDAVPFTPTRVVSTDGHEVLLDGGGDHLFLIGERANRLTVRTRFPYAPERHPTDRHFSDVVGASLAPNEHLVVWDVISSMRSVGDLPIRLDARFLRPERQVGEPCVGGFECRWGFCVDGVCCGSACGDGDPSDCQACSVAAGGTQDGVCRPVSAGAVCRPTAGACDGAEVCNGTSWICPPDGPAPDGTPCDDGLTCTSEAQCIAGECTASTSIVCEPPSPCMTGACSEPDGCAWTAIPGCCTQDEECDDGEAMTLDECVDAMCRWTERRLDAGPPPPPDAGPSPDAGPPPSADAGTPPAPDAGAPPDAAPPGPTVPPGMLATGCGCRTTPSNGGGLPALLTLAALLALRRRS